MALEEIKSINVLKIDGGVATTTSHDLSFINAYAYLGFADQSFSFATTGPGTFDQITNGTSNLFSYSSTQYLTTASDQITIPTNFGGLYKMTYGFSFAGVNANVVKLSLFINGSPVTNGGRCERGMGSADAGVTSTIYWGLLSDADVVDVRMERTAGTDSIVLINGFLCLEKK